LTQLASFVRWLPKHAAHLGSISISLDKIKYKAQDMPWQTYATVFQQALCMAMHVAGSQQPRSAAAAAAAGSQHSPDQPLLSWRLGSFTSDLPGAAQQLAVLPAHSLTHLQLDLQYDTAVNAVALSAALAGLTSLQFLCLKGSCQQAKAAPASCLAGIAQLSKLTELQLHNCWSSIDQPLQQLLAHPVRLRKLQLHVCSDLPDLNLAHLTQLEVLEHSWGALTPATVLPQQLQRLQLGAVECAADLVVPMQLPALKWLSILVRSKKHALLLQLAQHTSLQRLMLVYDGSDEAAATAAVWKQLPQLRGLTMLWENSIPGVEQAAAILAGAAGATRLTKLVFPAQVITDGEEEEDWDAPPPEVAVCASLAAVTSLEELQLNYGYTRLAAGDALALIALTNLTQLLLLSDSPGEHTRCSSRGIDGATLPVCWQQLHVACRSCGILSWTTAVSWVRRA
jgi:hypothetical protein